MATTRIIPLHCNKGKTIAQCLTDRTDYAENPEKTEGGTLISSFACDPKTAASEFALSKWEYVDPRPPATCNRNQYQSSHWNGR